MRTIKNGPDSLQIKGIVFDFDGVLALSTLLSTMPVEVIKTGLIKIGVSSSDIERLIMPAEFRVGGNWIEAVKSRILKPLEIFEHELQERAIESISEAYCRYQEKHDVLKLYSAFENLIPALAQHYRLFIFSNNSESNITRILGSLRPYVEIILTYQCVDSIKPDSEGIAFICSRARLGCENIVMIGDGFNDLKAAIGDYSGERDDINKAYFAIASWDKNRESLELSDLFHSRILGPQNRVLACFQKPEEVQTFFL